MISLPPQVYGNPINIQRAECIGIWSWLVFIRHYITFYGIAIAATIKAYCDNQTVIRQSQLAQDELHLADHMLANYDIINDIRHNIRILGPSFIVPLTIEHIPSHKLHKNTTYASQRAHDLHDQADMLATEAHASTDKETPQIHSSPNTLCTL